MGRQVRPISKRAGFAARQADLKGLRAVKTYSAQVTGEDGDFTSFGVYLNFENETETLDGLTETGAREIKTKFEHFINSPQQERLNIENSRLDWLRIFAGRTAILFVSWMTVSGLKKSRKLMRRPFDYLMIAANPIT